MKLLAEARREYDAHRAHRATPEQQELIEEENEQNEENASTGLATPRDIEDIDEKEDAIAMEAKSVSPEQVKEAAEAEQEMLDARRSQEVTPKKNE
ncbi:hypothetical protein HYQ44_001642 [Verticillium longisporum]|nr:hypothetical protein HYQ44_001642 [Verticillium longisporum]